MLVVARARSQEIVVVFVLAAKRSDGEGEEIHVLPVRPTLAADRAITSKTKAAAARAQTAGGLLCCQCSGRQGVCCARGSSHLVSSRDSSVVPELKAAEAVRNDITINCAV